MESKVKYRATLHLQDENGVPFSKLVIGDFDSAMDASVASAKESAKRNNVVGVTVRPVEEESCSS